MSHDVSRRKFLHGAATGGVLAGLGDMAFLKHLPIVSAADMVLTQGRVSLAPDIEPLVRLLEDTPRARLLERVAERIRQGTTYREVLTALQLAGVRNVQPRPSVGFKFHAVLVVNSAHLASLASPPEHRWLPIFWSLDYFKSAQAQDVRENDWTMQAVDEARVPRAEQASDLFAHAMERWDESAADTAVAALARDFELQEVYEPMFRYGMRDFRSIGHKAIFVANSYRTLREIGWQHAEPILRSLAYALLMHEGTNPADRDSEYDRDGRENLGRMQEIRADWAEGRLDHGAATQLLSTLHAGTPAEASAHVVELLNAGVAPQSLWDALLCSSGETLVREPGIASLHTVTTTNALRFAYDTSRDDTTRRLTLLQNAAFIPWMRQQRLRLNGPLAKFHLTELVAREGKTSPEDALTAIFAEISGNRLQAAERVLGYLEAGHSSEQLIEQARMLIFLKGRDSHDYKFSSAVLEDYYRVSPEWRHRFLASSVFHLAGSGAKDNELVARTRAAFAS
ncbi:MAG: twin-arginine translocation signal domain-containing protein [Planctomycetaceae bacterium]|nr:twin-arginine translocation signal domain-containing protein [Planctomycetaceae bacterium]